MSSEEGARELDALRGQDAAREGILAGIAATPNYEPEVYLVAAEANDGVNRTDPNRTVGVVSAQLRRRAPLIAGPGAEGGDPSAVHLPSVPLPSPHVYLCNMYVDSKFRKRGVGTALLSAAGDYARNWSERLGEGVPLVLSVDNDNIGAVRLYEKGGFEYLEKNDVFCVMEKWP